MKALNWLHWMILPLHRMTLNDMAVTLKDVKILFTYFYLFTSTQFATYIKKWLWPTMFTMTIYKICLFGWISEYKSLFWHFTEWHLFLWTLLPHDEYTEFSTIEEQESPFASSHKGSSGVLLMMSHIVVWLSLFIMI